MAFVLSHAVKPRVIITFVKFIEKSQILLPNVFYFSQKSCRFNDEPITVRSPSIEHTDSVEDDEPDTISDDNHRNEENHGEENHDEENSDIYPPPPEIKAVHSDGSDDDDDMYGDGAVSREEEDIDGDCGGVSILVTQASPSDDSTDSM